MSKDIEMRLPPKIFKLFKSPIHKNQIFTWKKQEVVSERVNEVLESEVDEEQILGAGEGDYIIVLYENSHYPGQIIQKCDNNIKVKCLELAGKYGIWKWRKREDVLWFI
jgi:hypothetical protein